MNALLTFLRNIAHRHPGALPILGAIAGAIVATAVFHAALYIIVSLPPLN